MAMVKEDLIEHIMEAFPDADVDIVDLAGDGDHYRATIISKFFQSKTLIEQHKMVYDALKGKMGGELHALSLKTKAKD